MSLSTTRTEAVLSSIERLCDSDLRTQELIEQVGAKLTQAVPASGLFIAATDPETTLCTGSGVVLEMPEEMCAPMWDHEFLVPDYNKFADIAQGPSAVADLHRATGGRPQRSARYREIHTLSGYVAETRMAFMAGGSPWGVGQLNRTDDLPLFDEDELAFLEAAAPIIGRGLRAAVLAETPSAAPVERGPGILVLDGDGRLVSITPEAEAWLHETGSTIKPDLGLNIPLPIEAYAYAMSIRAPEGATSVRPPRARLRTRDGMWLTIHAAPLRGADEDSIALVIEPAKASEVAPIIVEAYGLTPRELDVTRLVAKGLKTADIAARLHLSAHTVRDHLKSVFEKVGVSSRGELVSQLFAEHYYDELQDAIHAATPPLDEYVVA